eukprot:4743890-Amphidinium_carterae.1
MEARRSRQAGEILGRFGAVRRRKEGQTLDQTFDVAYLTQERSAAGKHQAGVFLDCSKCYERIPFSGLDEFAIETGYPLHALSVALNMYSGKGRILVQGAVSEGVTATCGLPPGCGRSLESCKPSLYFFSVVRADRQRQVLKSLTAVNMRVNAVKILVLCNGSVTKRKLMQVWRHGRLPP